MELDRDRSADGFSQRVRSMVSVMCLFRLGNSVLILSSEFRGGKISFSVGSNVPFLKVSGSSSTVSGSGEGTVRKMSRKCACSFEFGPKR